MKYYIKCQEALAEVWESLGNPYQVLGLSLEDFGRYSGKEVEPNGIREFYYEHNKHGSYHTEIEDCFKLKNGSVLFPSWAVRAVDDSGWGKFKGSAAYQAMEILNGSRDADYGDCVENFARIARLASIMCGKEITPYDACNVLIAVKLSREAYKHKEDNIVDMIGYLEILNKLKK